mmetsp:Transcript_13356/g.46208  ORF Transcript_13356/g.46208 Transcript_13356/m.46208 type:complete len:266 (-) Transcript_13356:138-935(-)
MPEQHALLACAGQPDKVLVVFRNPVARLLSAFNHFCSCKYLAIRHECQPPRCGPARSCPEGHESSASGRSQCHDFDTFVAQKLGTLRRECPALANASREGKLTPERVWEAVSGGGGSECTLCTKRMSPLCRGVYAWQSYSLLRWLPRASALFVSFEDLYLDKTRQPEAWTRVLGFLGLPTGSGELPDRANVTHANSYRAPTKVEQVRCSVRRELEAFYAPFEQAFMDTTDPSWRGDEGGAVAEAGKAAEQQRRLRAWQESVACYE